MLNRLRQRSSDEGGFTLIELLVVILIIGILAAIAIPSFLCQKSKATASQAKELARTAETTAETYRHRQQRLLHENHDESLHEYEPSIVTETNGKEAYLAEAEEVEEARATRSSPKVPKTATFTHRTQQRRRNQRTCEPVKVGSGCSSGSW